MSEPHGGILTSCFMRLNTIFFLVPV